MMNTNMSVLDQKDRSQVNMLSMKNDHNALAYEAIIHGDHRLLPYFLGGHQGYYSDQNDTPNYDAIELVIEFLALSVLVITWVFYQIQFNEYPDMVPILRDSQGKAVKNSQKLILYVFPGVDTFIFVILTILQFITNRFQYNIAVTPENSRQIFRLTRKFILVSKLITMIVFVFLTFGTLSIVNYTLNAYVLSYAIALLMLYGMVYYWYTMRLQNIANKSY